MSRKIFYNETNYDDHEINAVQDVLKKNEYSLVGGEKTKKFEEKISLMFGKKYGLFVNSGSSANLLALASLNLPEKSEIITPSLTFSTTISPILQLGLIPNIIDIEINTLNIDVSKIEKAITKNTKAILVPNLMGNIPNWKKIKKIAKSKKIFVIEDSADTLGYSIEGKNTGNLSDIVTTSFYASHIITCGGIGGMVCTNNKNFYEKMKVIRGWGRSSELYPADSSQTIKSNINSRFNIKIGNIHYDRKFLFSKPGYNFLAPEICAAFGLAQLKKFKKLYKKRVNNFNFLKKLFFDNLSDKLITPNQNKNVDTIWLAYPVILNNNNNKLRNKLQIYLEKNNIQTRPIFSGNITRQPLLKNKKYITNNKKFNSADYIMRNGLLVGCHPKLKNSDLRYVYQKIKNFLDNE